jgi:hypothetical protein
MRQEKLILSCPHLVKLAAVALLLTSVCAVRDLAQQAGQKTFSMPDEASKALYMAAKNNDEKAMLELLGPQGKEIVSSGDEAQDRQSRENFAKRYEEMNRLVKELDGTVTLYIGPHNWPYPIPLVEKGNQWYFDTRTGKQEILYRRIGRNETSAIHVCEQLVAAQKEYYAQHHNEYAQKIFSDAGKHDGLYWKVSDDEPPSPIGPLVAWANVNEHAKDNGAVAPYHGYYFQILTRQGKDSAGGAKNYIVDGKMTGGFAFVAYPAEYRSSGVMTFLAGDDGVIYEKDLGKKTETAAQGMKEYDPTSGWKKVEADDRQQASGTEATK